MATTPAVHNGTYTLTHAAGHYTVKVRRQKDDAKFAPGEQIISLLSGPDNESDYQGFGFVKPNGRVILWRRHRDSRIMIRLAHLFELAAPSLSQVDEVYFEDHGRSYNLKVAKTCQRCNRKLTHPDSLISGYGPECAAQAA